jgi:predicted histidine transporter YuiF (NhaC family)
MSDEYIEDRKYLNQSIQNMQKNIEKLFENDTEIKVTLATINTKLMVVSALSSTVVGTLVAFVMNSMLGTN